MSPNSLNLFIVNNDPSMMTELRHYLQKQFGNVLNIYTFKTGKTALRELNKDTRIVILDAHLAGENETEVQKSIREKNPNTEVIMLSTNEDIATAISNYREIGPAAPGKTEPIKRKIASRIYRVLNYPIYLLVKEFGVTKFVAIFLMSWFTVAIVVIVALSIILNKS